MIFSLGLLFLIRKDGYFMEELVNFFKELEKVDVASWSFEDQLKLLMAFKRLEKDVAPLIIKNENPNSTFLFKME